MKELTDQYMKSVFIDYGDLNEQAEKQIREAFEKGLTVGINAMLRIQEKENETT